MIVRHHRPDNGHGWKLDLRQTWIPERLDPTRRPLLIIPGYGMNNFIFSFHPTGTSMERFLAEQGFDVWSANLRGQGRSRRYSGPSRYGFRELALVDLPCAIETVRAETATQAQGLDVVGCSLGAAITYSYLAHHPHDHPVGSMVSIGGPLRWDHVHPVIKVAFTSARVAGMVPVRGVRQMARLALPLARRVPAALSIYMNAKLSDLSQAEELIRTVENPNPWLNRQMARWIQQGDLVVDGLNITQALPAAAPPLLVVAANSDGVVPPQVALSVVEVLGQDRVQVLEVGDDHHKFAHADLFISRLSHEQVFLPMGQWLQRQQ